MKAALGSDDRFAPRRSICPLNLPRRVAPSAGELNGAAINADVSNMPEQQFDDGYESTVEPRFSFNILMARAEFFAAWRALMIRNPWLWIQLLIGAALVAEGLTTSSVVFAIGGAAFVIFCVGHAFYARPTHIWETSSLRTGYTLDIYDDGVLAKSSKLASRSDWGQWRVRDCGAVYALRLGASTLFVPKRLFPDSADQADFYKFVSNHCGQG
jgi:hypothetical protein